MKFPPPTADEVAAIFLLAGNPIPPHILERLKEHAARKPDETLASQIETGPPAPQ
jgi:hypothetical protein